MRKNFVLDTNVLLYDPRSLFSFGDNDVTLPIFVIEEIDTFKKDHTSLGRNARLVARSLDELRATASLRDGAPLGEGLGTIRVVISDERLSPEFGDPLSTDSKILAVALGVHKGSSRQTILVSKDTNLRIRADALGLTAEDYNTAELQKLDELDSGVREISVPGTDIDEFYAIGALSHAGKPPPPNEFAVLRNESNPQHSAIARYSAAKQAYVPLLKQPKEGVWGIRPRNKEQSFALDLLMDDSVSLVTIVGKAGTGKTLLAIAAGLQKTMEERVYQKIIVSRPVMPLGKQDIGFLPGTVEEKLSPWMQPIFDNAEFLMGLTRTDKKQGRSYQELIDMGMLAIEPLTYIRGRSIPNQFMIVDEAQNLTPHEVKTIITRVGEGTKIVLTGDPYQIDNPYLDATNNGLVHVANRFHMEPVAGHITMFKGERSFLAELAANIL